MNNAPPHREQTMSWSPSLRPIVIGGGYLILYCLLENLRGVFEVATGISLFYPPAGMALALLTVFGLRYLPVVFLSQVLSTTWMLPHLEQPANLWGVGITVLLAYSIAAIFLRRLLGPEGRMQTLRDVGWFFAVALITPLAVAILAGMEMIQAGLASWADYRKGVLDWWLGDALGYLVMTPFLLIHGRLWGRRLFLRMGEWLRFGRPLMAPVKSPGRKRLTEIVCQGLGLSAIVWLAFASRIAQEFYLIYFCFFPLIWIVVRHGLAGATAGLLLINLGAQLAVRTYQVEIISLDELRLFLLGTTLTGLLLGAVVSERQQSDRALRDLESIYRRAIAAGNAVPYHQIFQPNHYVYMGTGIEELTGYSATEMSPLVWDSILQKCELHGAAAGLTYAEAKNRAERGDFANWKADCLVVRRDGQLRWIADVAVHVLDDEGRPAESIGMLQDITDRKQAEEAMRENEEKYRSIVETTHEWLWAIDLEWRLTYTNPAVEEILGYAPGELIGRNCLQLLHPEDRLDMERTFPELKQTQRGWMGLVLRWQHKNGSFRHLESNSTPLLNQRGELIGFRGADRDITQRKLDEQKRLELERKLLDSQKLESLGVLAGGIAHEFNNMLTVILGNSSLASMQMGASSPFREYFQNIEKTSLRAAELCKQMLAYSGRGRFMVQHLDINTLVREMTHLLQISVDRKILLRFQYGKNLLAIEADPMQVRQAIMNLVVNASEAIGEASGTIRVSTGMLRANREYLAQTYLAPELPEGDYVFVEVADTGCGMDAETQSKIFDPFFSTKFTGRGLGLAAVLGIVRGHNGALKLDSTVGQGTTFRLLFPGLHALPERPMEDAAFNTAYRGEGTILVVDDEESVRSFLAQVLEAFGFKVLLAADGREGLALFTKNASAITLTILDLTMPRMNGEETFREIRKLQPEARVLLTSGYDEREAVARFRAKGLSGFLQKPFQPLDVARILQQVLPPHPSRPTSPVQGNST
ncbi:MAG: PAS domain S-box protein [Verrucomicrobiota bacterium]